MQLDGNVAVTVQVRGRDVVAVRVVEEQQDSISALTAALVGLPAKMPVMVAICAPAQASLQFTTSAQLTTAQQMEDAARQHVRISGATPLPDTGVAAGGVLSPPPRSTARARAVVCTAPANAVRAAYEALHEAGGRGLVSVPALLTGSIGPGAWLLLALRRTSSEVTLVIDGHPVATTMLDAGGLAHVEAILGSGEQVGPDRVADVLTHGGVHDPMAASTVDRWLGDVITQMSAAVDGWRSAGLPVPANVVVHGPGAASVSLPFLLQDAGWTRQMVPAGVAAAMLSLPAGQRPLVLGAYLAAVSAHDPPQSVVLADTSTATLRRAASLRRRRALSTLVAWTTTLLVAGAGPAVAVATYTSVQEARTTQQLTQVAASTASDPTTLLQSAQALAAAPVRADVAEVAAVGALPNANVTATEAGVHVAATVTDLGAVTTAQQAWAAAGFVTASLTLTRVNDTWQVEAVLIS